MHAKEMDNMLINNNSYVLLWNSNRMHEYEEGCMSWIHARKRIKRMKLYFNVFMRSNKHLQGLCQTASRLVRAGALQPRSTLFTPQLCGISSADGPQPDNQPLLLQARALPHSAVWRYNCAVVSSAYVFSTDSFWEPSIFTTMLDTFWLCKKYLSNQACASVAPAQARCVHQGFGNAAPACARCGHRHIDISIYRYIRT